MKNKLEYVLYSIQVSKRLMWPLRAAIVYGLFVFINYTALPTTLFPPLVYSEDGHRIINTGIKAGGCWYDDEHFIVIQGQQSPGSQEFEVEGLYSLDPRKPKELKRIDLSPIEPILQKQIRDVSCQEKTVLFHMLSPDRKRNKLYTLEIGQQPELLAEKTEGFVVPRAVSVKGQYVLGFSSALRECGLLSSASPEQARRDCRLAYLRSEYLVVCLMFDRSIKRTWPLSTGLLTEYMWDETIRVSKDGKNQWVPNPERPLKLPDGTELKQGYLLRDLKNQIVQQIPLQQGVYRIERHFMLPNQGEYLYAICSRSGDHDPKYGPGGRICRYKVDGKNLDWEEVASVQQRPGEPFSLQDLDVNLQADIVVVDRGHRGATSLWKYTARSKKVEKVTFADSRFDLGAPHLSPHGAWISFMQQQTLHLAKAKE